MRYYNEYINQEEHNTLFIFTYCDVSQDDTDG